MPIEPDRAVGEAIEVRGCELRASIGAEHVAIEAVEQDNDNVPRHVHRHIITGRTPPMRTPIVVPYDRPH